MAKVTYIVVAWKGSERVRLERTEAGDAFGTSEKLQGMGWRVSLRRVVAR